MGKITVVCTMHRELGQCNHDELLRILEKIGPDVIFEEIRRSDFESHYRDESLHTLEMRAVSQYVKGRAVRQVPVDDFTIPENFRSDNDELFKYVVSRSRDYHELSRVEKEEIFQFGFMYLNSPEWEALDRRIRGIFEETIDQSGDDDLKKKLSTWNDLVRKREVIMVENIHAFCRKNQFTNGVFLVGSAHKLAIVEEISKLLPAEADLINWNFGNLPY